MMKNRMLVFVWCAMAVDLRAQISDFAQRDFRKADSIAELYPRYSINDLEGLAKKLTTPLSTDQEKFRAIYKWVCNNIDYDYDLFLRNRAKRESTKISQHELDEWNRKFSMEVFRELVAERRTICSGYALLVKLLANHAGMKCEIVDGFGRTASAMIRKKGRANHSWNAVELNGKWYLCDATWSSGHYDVEKSEFIKKFEPSYFLADPRSFIRNHYPLDSSWMLVGRRTTLEKFLSGPLTYLGAYKFKIERMYPESFNVVAEKGKSVSFQFSSGNDNPIERAELVVVKDSYFSPAIRPTLRRDCTGLYSMEHVFTSRGTSVVHILLNGTYASSYSVRVK